jgi:hypothetical protein
VFRPCATCAASAKCGFARRADVDDLRLAAGKLASIAKDCETMRRDHETMTAPDFPPSLQVVLERTNAPFAADIDRNGHLRYELYVETLVSAYPDDIGLLACVARDPDVAMREAAVGAYIDSVARLLPRLESFQGWYDKRRNLIDVSRFPARRAKEWLVYKAVLGSKKVASADYLEASPWLQRELAANAPSSEVLRELAQDGRSKRARWLASKRLRALRINGKK